VATLKLENPYTFEIITEIPYSNLEEADNRLNKSHEFFKTWKSTSLHERKQAIRSLISYLDKVIPIQNQDLIAREITMQMGKPIKQSYQEIQDVIHQSNTLLDLSDKALESEIIEISKGTYKTIEKIPLGPVFIIASHDFPLTYVAGALVPAILAGNTVFIKPSPYTPITTQHFEKAFAEAGLPDLVQSSLLPVASISQFFSNSNLGYVNFFGNVLSGKEVYENVSESSCITDVGLFLGCNNGAYVAEDADIENAVKDVIDSTMLNSGQSTYKIDRILVQKEVYTQFLEAAEHYVKQFKIGDPMEYTTKIGPIAVPENLENIKEQIDEALQTNADLRVGGNITNDESGNGRFFEPTLISDLDDSMRIFVISS
jgi:acyl-CoA reductase-like NAD-dependent aldehyde dehydrogenase